MAEFPTYEQMAKDVAEKALDEYLIDGKTLREWIKIIAEQEYCGDCVSIAEVMNMAGLYADWFESSDSYNDFVTELRSLPSVTPQEPKTGWNNHQIACMLADLFNDACACNYNGIDEWLPELCDFEDTCCPNPVGVACWEQFLKYSQSRYTECGYEVKDKNALQEPKTDYKSFAEWLADEIFSENWEYNKDGFEEIACRKLAKLGLVKADGDKWVKMEG